MLNPFKRRNKISVPDVISRLESIYDDPEFATNYTIKQTVYSAIACLMRNQVYEATKIMEDLYVSTNIQVIEFGYMDCKRLARQEGVW